MWDLVARKRTHCDRAGIGTSQATGDSRRVPAVRSHWQPVRYRWLEMEGLMYQIVAVVLMPVLLLLGQEPLVQRSAIWVDTVKRGNIVRMAPAPPRPPTNRPRTTLH